MLTPPLILGFTTKTWNRDSHGLFDYESSQCVSKSLYFSQSGIMTRTAQNVKSNPSPGTNHGEIILVVTKNKDNYFISNPIAYNQAPSVKAINSLSNKLWYIISKVGLENQNEEYFLNVNDIIKLGRVKYAISEYNISDITPVGKQENSYNLSFINSSTKPVFNLIFQAERYDDSLAQINDEQKMCKICYSDENEDTNPWVHLCSCKGGIRFAHHRCIQLWMKTKWNIKANEFNTVKSYNIKSFNCEICKTPYPFKYQIKNTEKIYDWIEIPRPTQGDYLILESLNQVKDDNNIKSLHLIELRQEKFVIGRGHESDVRINDISVSRAHAILVLDKTSKRLLWTDLNSKFGTWVLIKEPLLINKNKLNIQIGMSFLETQLIEENKEYAKHDQIIQGDTLSLNSNEWNANFFEEGNEEKEKETKTEMNHEMRDNINSNSNDKH